MRNISCLQTATIFVLAGSLTCINSSAHAQLTIADSGLSDQEIPLAGNLEISGDGKITAHCSGDICANLGQQSSVVQPIVNFTNPADSVTLEQNVTTLSNVTVSGNATATGALVCRYTATNGVTGWAGFAEMARTSGPGVRVVSTVSFPANTTATAINYELTAQCGLPQSNGGWSAAVTRTVTVPPGTGGGGGSSSFGSCQISNPSNSAVVTLDDANRTNWPVGFDLVRPVGFTPYNRSWTDQFGQAFGIEEQFPSTIGAFSVDAEDSRGMYVTIPFTPPADGQWTVRWDSAQVNERDNYFNPQPATPVFLSISPCAGDVRPRDSGTTDPWLRFCRWTLGAGSLTFNSRDVVGCEVEAGKTYWLTVMMADPRDGLTLQEETCSNSGSVACDVAIWFLVEGP